MRQNQSTRVVTFASLAGVLLLSFVAAYWLGAWLRAQPPAFQIIDGLVVSSSDLEVGEIWETKELTWRLPIRNSTDQAIAIRDFTTTCGCVAVEPRSLSVPAKQTATIALKLDLASRHHGELGVANRPFSVTIMPVLSARSDSRRGWALRGVVKSRVTLDTLAVHFGEQPAQPGRPRTQKVLATVHVPCKEVDVSVSQDIATAHVQQRDEAHFEITLAVNPHLQPGDFKTEARINVVEPNDDKVLGLILPIAGRVQPSVRLLPTQVFLEPRHVGQTAEAIVTLQAPLESMAVIDHIETDNDGCSVAPATIEGVRAGCAYRISQKIEREGEQVSVVRFVFRKPGQKLDTLRVEVFFRGDSSQRPEATTSRETQP